MGLRSGNIQIGKVTTSPAVDAPRKMSVGEKLYLKINKSKDVELYAKKIEIKEVIEEPVKKIEVVQQEIIKTDDTNIKLLMKDQIVKSSKYLQDLTYEENY